MFSFIGLSAPGNKAPALNKKPFLRQRRKGCLGCPTVTAIFALATEPDVLTRPSFSTPGRKRDRSRQPP
jgi:hypothetical protein